MKEIKILLQNLKKYPPNSFIYVSPGSVELSAELVVTTYEGEQLGVIEVGSDNQQVILH